MKHGLLLLLLLAAIGNLRAASLVEGIVYLRDGRTIACTDRDRIRLPKKRAALKIYRNAYSRGKSRESYPIDQIDSIVCWHPRSPKYRWRFLPLPAGWSRLYFETPRIRVYIYAAKGYGLSENGGIRTFYKARTFSRSRTAYLLQRVGEEEFYPAGSASRNSKEAFRERICRYIADDPALCERIRQSSTSRSKTVLMLRDYAPDDPPKPTIP